MVLGLTEPFFFLNITFIHYCLRLQLTMSRAVKELYDVLVVGLGAVGSAACYHASKQGKVSWCFTLQ